MVEPVLKERVAPIKLFISALVVALQYYRQEFGAFPREDNRSVFAALRGKNPKSMVLIEPKRYMIENDELVDPWGTPLAFNFDSNLITIISAGPNVAFGDHDDIVRTNPF
jgi:hypothetical protein